MFGCIECDLPGGHPHRGVQGTLRAGSRLQRGQSRGVTGPGGCKRWGVGGSRDPGGGEEWGRRACEGQQPGAQRKRRYTGGRWPRQAQTPPPGSGWAGLPVGSFVGWKGREAGVAARPERAELQETEDQESAASRGPSGRSGAGPGALRLWGQGRAHGPSHPGTLRPHRKSPGQPG